MEEKRKKIRFQLTSRVKLHSFSKRKTVIDQQAMSWVKQNIKIKVKNENGYKEVSTNCFGEIDFKGTPRKTKAKFVRFADTTAPETIYKLMTEHWKLEKPRLLITICCDENAHLDSRIKEMMDKSLVNVAQTPGSWFLTDGINAGFVKHLGESLQSSSSICIGISSFNSVTNKENLVSSVSDSDLGGKFPYRISCSLLKEGSYLEHNHSHHLLVDDGTIEENEKSKVKFRSLFIDYIIRNAVGKVPNVLLIIQGNIDTLETVRSLLLNDLPISIVVIDGSGKVANLIAFSLKTIISKDHKKDHESQILAKVKEIFPELSDNEKGIICEMILFFMKKSELFTVFKFGGSKEIDEAIFTAMLKSENLPPVDQLQLTLLWNRADLAKEKVFPQTYTWKLIDLELAMLMALAMNRVDFVKLLIEYGVSIEQFLTNDILEFLYWFQSRSVTSTLNFHIDNNLYVPATLNEHAKAEITLMGFETVKTNAWAIPRRQIENLMKYLCKHLVSKREQAFIEKINTDLSSDDNVYFAFPYRELFFWAVLNNMHKMAIYLWRFEEEAMNKALIAAEINNSLYENAKRLDLQEDIANSFLRNSNEFKSLALELLDECYKTNESKTVQLITCEFNQFSDQTSLGLAVDTNDLDFVSHSSVQLLLNEIWSGRVKKREVNTIKMLSAYFFPPLINQISFYSEEAFNAMLFVNDTECVEERHSTCQNNTNGKDERYLLRHSDHSFKLKPPQMPFLHKCYQFYFKTPAIKFYSNVTLYFMFLILFWYVCIRKIENRLLLAEYFLVIYVFSITVSETYQVIQTEGHNIKTKLREWSRCHWNKLDTIAIVIFFLALAFRLNEETLEVAHILYALDGGLWVIRLLQAFFVHRILGPYVMMVFRMTQDLIYLLVILLVFLISYGVTSKAILNPGNADLKEIAYYVLLRPYYNIYGELFTNDDGATNTTTSFGTPVESSYGEAIAWVLLGIYMIVSNVLLLNIIIAVFNNTFNSVQENAEQIWKFQRHGLVVEYAQRAHLPLPFSLIVHAILLARWILQKCGVVSKKGCNQPILKAHVTLEKKEELIEFENLCLTKFVRHLHISSSGTFKKDLVT